MGGVTGFLFVYVLGGLTFPILIISLVLCHAYLTVPIHEDSASRESGEESIVQPGDDVDALKTAQKTLRENSQFRNHETDVAAGTFSIFREYSPGGVNSKPLERQTPAGTGITAPSPSIYQSMYRSVFDRKQGTSPLDNKGAGKPQKKGGNVFYVVLRHGHLMLFDDEEQLEVRHVISLAHHNVSIYSGGDDIPEGELFIKRNAVCLSRKTSAGALTPDGTASKPFYLFSEQCSEKEDFYFALLRNQERKADANDNPPIPLQYDVKDIITLVQKLHSSEEHLQTRWINAIIGRVFLALYKTPEMENFIRAKITKKISRVKTPSFLSRIVLQHVDLGEAAPVITNPRLKDLTVDGELVVEADVRYSGNFRLEVAATARIDLGTRFKAREVNLLLAVVVKRVEGHAMLRIKPPPSNRIWVTFSTNPKIDMTIEPIVSSRQITYTLILRQIENRIKEVVAESLVYPNWDDLPFFHTQNGLWRGGIWAGERVAHRTEDPETAAAQEGDVDEVAHLEAEHRNAIAALPEVENSISMPAIDASPSGGIFARKGLKKSVLNLQHSKSSGSSTSVESRASAPEKPPRALRSGSFANASSPIVSTDVTNADAFKDSTPPEHSHAMAAISALSQSSSPAHTPVGSPSEPPSRMEKAGSHSSPSSHESMDSEKAIDNDLTPQPSLKNSDIISDSASSSHPPSPASMSPASFKSEFPVAKSVGFGHDPRRENSTSTSSSGQSSTSETKRLSLAAVTNAAATAKKWGWNAIQRRQDQRTDGATDMQQPSPPLVMGRGRPLPPPGTPLPPPDRKTKTAPIPVPKRKPLPPPSLPQRSKDSSNEANGYGDRRAVPPPPLPKRRSRDNLPSEYTDDGLFVVPAPTSDSLPGTPISEHPPEHAPVYMQPWVDDVDEDENEVQNTPQPEAASDFPSPETPHPPQVPKRRPLNRGLSTSPEEDGRKLPPWLAAQEAEQRAKSTWVDEDAGLQ